jgi:uncharacterized protein
MKRVAVLVVVVAALGPACKNDPQAPTAPATHVGGAPAVARAPGAGAANTNQVAAAPLQRPLLWSAEKAGRTTYFLGTMHMGVDAETRLPAVVWSTLRGAKAFAMETNLDDARTAALLEPRAASLRRELGEVYWKKLEDAMGARAAAALEHMPPMIPAAALSMRGLPTTPAMDRVLAARARSEGKPIVYLEPAARQLAILDRWMDIKALRMMLDELDGSEQHARAMLDAYIDGDEQRIIAIADGEKADALRHGYTEAEYTRQMDEMLYDRNASWIAPLEELHAAGGGFVAVGALHLVGPRSVLELLAGKGYKVIRLAP